MRLGIVDFTALRVPRVTTFWNRLGFCSCSRSPSLGQPYPHPCQLCPMADGWAVVSPTGERWLLVAQRFHVQAGSVPSSLNRGSGSSMVGL